MTQITARLELDDEPDVIDRDTRALLRDIASSVDIEAQLATEAAPEGTRAGMAPMLGQIAMALVSSGTIVSLLEVLKSYFGRKKSAKFSLTRADGASITIEMDDVSGDQFDKSLARLEAFFGQPAT